MTLVTTIKIWQQNSYDQSFSYCLTLTFWYPFLSRKSFHPTFPITLQSSSSFEKIVCFSPLIHTLIDLFKTISFSSRYNVPAWGFITHCLSCHFMPSTIALSVATAFIVRWSVTSVTSFIVAVILLCSIAIGCGCF